MSKSFTILKYCADALVTRVSARLTCWEAKKCRTALQTWYSKKIRKGRREPIFAACENKYSIDSIMLCTRTQYFSEQHSFLHGFCSKYLQSRNRYYSLPLEQTEEKSKFTHHLVQLLIFIHQKYERSSSSYSALSDIRHQTNNSVAISRFSKTIWIYSRGEKFKLPGLCSWRNIEYSEREGNHQAII